MPKRSVELYFKSPVLEIVLTFRIYYSRRRVVVQLCIQFLFPEVWSYCDLRQMTAIFRCLDLTMSNGCLHNFVTSDSLALDDY